MVCPMESSFHIPCFQMPGSTVYDNFFIVSWLWHNSFQFEREREKKVKKKEKKLYLCELTFFTPINHEFKVFLRMPLIISIYIKGCKKLVNIVNFSGNNQVYLKIFNNCNSFKCFWI
jgi:hypothetical protein